MDEVEHSQNCAPRSAPDMNVGLRKKCAVRDPGPASDFHESE
jgi:hypothetical protein